MKRLGSEDGSWKNHKTHGLYLLLNVDPGFGCPIHSVKYYCQDMINRRFRVLWSDAYTDSLPLKLLNNTQNKSQFTLFFSRITRYQIEYGVSMHLLDDSRVRLSFLHPNLAEMSQRTLFVIQHLTNRQRYFALLNLFRYINIGFNFGKISHWI